MLAQKLNGMDKLNEIYVQFTVGSYHLKIIF